MKKEVILSGLFLFLIIGMLFSVSALTPQQENSNISAAYQCLKDQIATEGCSALNPDQILYSSLLLDDCRERINETISPEGNCWPSGNCDLKTTSLYMIAEEGCSDISKPRQWLLDQKMTTTDLIWFLEIDGREEMNCEIIYDRGAESTSSSYEIVIQENKKVTPQAGPCLDSSEAGGYWYKIDKECYDHTFEISCDKSFITTLLFKEENSPTYYVLRDSHPAGARDTTNEKIESYCFEKNNECDYEGSLWAATMLKSLGENIQGYLPYLIEGSKDLENRKYFPAVFLYLITGELDYRTEILEEFRNSNYWDVSGDKYFDTGLGLWPFSSQSLEEKDLAKEWLIGDLTEEKCWNYNSIEDTAWLLYTIWPELSPEDKCGGGDDGGNESNESCELDSDCRFYYCEDWTKIFEDCIDGKCILNDYCENTTECETNADCTANYTCDNGEVLYSECVDSMCVYLDGCDFGEGDDDDCIEAGYSCTSYIDCGYENVLDDFTCNGGTYCCSQNPGEVSCSDLEGDVCGAGEYCPGTSQKTTDLYGMEETCCLNSECASNQGRTCEINEDCYSYEKCFDGFCELKDYCEQNSDCDSNRCVNNRCVSGSGGDNPCEAAWGTCSSSCGEGYKVDSSLSCDSSSKVCCMQEKQQAKWWIWLIFGLIVLAVLAIIFRDKLKETWMKVQTKFSKGGKGNAGPRGPPRGPSPTMIPPRYSQTPLRRPMDRKVLPPQNQPTMRRPVPPIRPPENNIPKKPIVPAKKPSSKSKEELDEVLKKLKDMSK